MFVAKAPSLMFIAHCLGLALAVGGGLQQAQAARPPSKLVPPPPPSGRPFLWQVLMSDPPQLQPYTNAGEKAVLQDLARTCNAIFLGEHAESAEDHELQVRRQLYIWCVDNYDQNRVMYM